MEASSYSDLSPRDVEYILENQPSNIERLPRELQEYVLLQLSYPDVIRLRGINTTFREIIDNDIFWKFKTQRDFGVPKEAPKVDIVTGVPVESWKEVYLSHGKLLKRDLSRAIRSNNSQLVQNLLDLGVNPNLADKYGLTALMNASKRGHTAIVKMLLEAGAKPNLQNETGWTALIEASDRGHTAIVEMLLNAEADPNIADRWGYTALMLASKKDHTDIVEMLLKAEAAFT